MKRIWLALGLTAAMLLLCGLLLGSTERLASEMLEQLDEIRSAGEDGGDAGPLIDRLLDQWEQWEEKLALHMRHSELEEVKHALQQISSCWNVGEHELFLMACDEAGVAVEHLAESSRLSLKNVL